MIYLCEYENQISSGCLREAALSRGLPLREGKQEEKEKQRLTAWLLLSLALEREYGISAFRQEDIRYGRQGKPYFTRWPEVYFNISHCQNACACILSEGENGIDVERRFPYRDSLARRVCHEAEWSYLQERCRSQEEKEWCLQALWSLKESFIKYDGRGLSAGMKNADFSQALGEKIRQNREVSYVFPQQTSLPKNGKPKPGFLWSLEKTVSFAACFTGDPPEICRITEKELESGLFP